MAYRVAAYIILTLRMYTAGDIATLAVNNSAA